MFDDTWSRVNLVFYTLYICSSLHMQICTILLLQILSEIRIKFISWKIIIIIIIIDSILSNNMCKIIFVALYFLLYCIPLAVASRYRDIIYFCFEPGRSNSNHTKMNLREKCQKCLTYLESSALTIFYSLANLAKPLSWFLHLALMIKK